MQDGHQASKHIDSGWLCQGQPHPRQGPVALEPIGAQHGMALSEAACRTDMGMCLLHTLGIPRA